MQNATTYMAGHIHSKELIEEFNSACSILEKASKGVNEKAQNWNRITLFFASIIKAMFLIPLAVIPFTVRCTGGRDEVFLLSFFDLYAAAACRRLIYSYKESCDRETSSFQNTVTRIRYILTPDRRFATDVLKDRSFHTQIESIESCMTVEEHEKFQSSFRYLKGTAFLDAAFLTMSMRNTWKDRFCEIPEYLKNAEMYLKDFKQTHEVKLLKKWKELDPDYKCQDKSLIQMIDCYTEYNQQKPAKPFLDYFLSKTSK